MDFLKKQETTTPISRELYARICADPVEYCRVILDEKHNPAARPPRRSTLCDRPLEACNARSCEPSAITKKWSSTPAIMWVRPT